MCKCHLGEESELTGEYGSIAGSTKDLAETHGHAFKMKPGFVVTCFS